MSPASRDLAARIIRLVSGGLDASWRIGWWIPRLDAAVVVELVTRAARRTRRGVPR